jgi:hypothetical protein
VRLHHVDGGPVDGEAIVPLHGWIAPGLPRPLTLALSPWR